MHTERRKRYSSLLLCHEHLSTTIDLTTIWHRCYLMMIRALRGCRMRKKGQNRAKQTHEIESRDTCSVCTSDRYNVPVEIFTVDVVSLCVCVSRNVKAEQHNDGLSSTLGALGPARSLADRAEGSIDTNVRFSTCPRGTSRKELGWATPRADSLALNVHEASRRWPEPVHVDRPLRRRWPTTTLTETESTFGHGWSWRIFERCLCLERFFFFFSFRV